MSKQATQDDIRREVLDLIGCTELELSNVKLHPDPFVDGVWAVRVEADHYLPDFLRHADGELEEVEFHEWPPRARI